MPFRCFLCFISISDFNIEDLFEAFVELKKEFEALKQENAALKAEIARLKQPKKDSSNSSIAPSQDENRVQKNKSLRRKSGKQVGGQKGHRGSHLKMVEHPDQLEVYQPEVCKNCSTVLLDSPSTIVEKRQVSDIILPKKQVTEYQKHSICCPVCRFNNLGQFPKNIPKGCSYGKTVTALIAYLQVRHFLPYARTAEFFFDLFGIKISGGTIKNKLMRLYKSALPTYQTIKTNVLKSNCIGSDETGFKINGKKHWAWVWQNDSNTFISINRSRGYKAVLAEFDEQDFNNTILVCDRYAAQLKTNSKTKQFCLAHLLRDLTYLSQLYKQPWSDGFKAVLLKIYDLKRQSKKYDELAHQIALQSIEAKIEQLVNQKIAIKYKQLRTFKEKIKKHQSFVTTCLHYKSVPPDNNWSERAIRNFKVIQKVSGGFRSTSGAKIYATLRSITDTAIKQNANVWQTFNNLALIKAE